MTPRVSEGPSSPQEGCSPQVQLSLWHLRHAHYLQNFQAIWGIYVKINILKYTISDKHSGKLFTQTALSGTIMSGWLERELRTSSWLCSLFPLEAVKASGSYRPGCKPLTPREHLQLVYKCLVRNWILKEALIKLGLAFSGLRKWHLGLFTQIGMRSYLHFKYIFAFERINFRWFKDCIWRSSQKNTTILQLRLPQREAFPWTSSVQLHTTRNCPTQNANGLSKISQSKKKNSYYSTYVR